MSHGDKTDNCKNKTMDLSYHIYYSKEFKLYDVVIKKNNQFLSQYHISNKKELLKLIHNKK